MTSDEKYPLGSPPCQGCIACCRHDAVFLHPEHGDDPRQYSYEVAINPLTGAPGFKILNQLSGPLKGACHYLGKDGCTIYERRPLACRQFDCRGMIKMLERYPRPERRRMIREHMSKDVIAAGKARMGTLPRKE